MIEQDRIEFERWWHSQPFAFKKLLPSMEASNLVWVEAARKTRAMRTTARPKLIAEAIAELEAARIQLFEVSGSALLAGEKCKHEDKAICYRLVCESVTKIAYAIDILGGEDADGAAPLPDEVARMVATLSEMCWDECDSAAKMIERLARQVPEGCVVVPREPTEVKNG